MGGQRPQPLHAGDGFRGVLKGEHAATATVAIPGGVDANRRIPIAMTFPGAPRIAPSEEVFLFLTHAGDEIAGSYGVTGFAQGKFSIVAW